MGQEDPALQKADAVEGIQERSDEELLVGSSERPECFIAFYDRTLPGLLAFFARRTLDGQLSADLTAETLADAYASRSRFRDRGRGSAQAWLYTIAQRKLGRFLRRRRVEDVARRRLGLPSIELSTDDVERIEALIDFAEVGRAVAAAFGGLAPEQREALRLRVIEGHSFRLVAETLGCSEETARARVSRGLRHLARDLEPWR
jgi:RNA polymerase sigma-70 factor (ECF subfamily)